MIRRILTGAAGMGLLVHRKRQQPSPFYNDRLLLKGDLHCHSIYSCDGVFSVKQIAGYCQAAGMDFTAITDHNSIDAFSDEGSEENIIFLKGSECSLSEKCGHFNVLGIEEIDLRPDMTEKEEIISYMDKMKQRGAKIQLNHPFAGTLGWHAGWDVPFDLVEIWNREFSERNLKAIEWWHEQLCQGIRIPATGGTDSHSTKSERYPVNCVYARERTPEAILEAVGQGNSFISECTYGPWIQLKIGKAIIGDQIPAKEGELLEAFFENLEAGYTVRILSDNGVEFSKMVENGFCRTTLLVSSKRLFYRGEVWRGEILAAISNPIYLRREPGAEQGGQKHDSRI